MAGQAVLGGILTGGGDDQAAIACADASRTTAASPVLQTFDAKVALTISSRGVVTPAEVALMIQPSVLSRTAVEPPVLIEFSRPTDV
jgi:hypothetical protein